MVDGVFPRHRRSTPRPHFGLGDAEKADEVVVCWPNGTRSVRRNVPARQFLVVRKGT